jgi:hypothetical protein
MGPQAYSLLRAGLSQSSNDNYDVWLGSRLNAGEGGLLISSAEEEHALSLRNAG